MGSDLSDGLRGGIGPPADAAAFCPTGSPLPAIRKPPLWLRASGKPEVFFTQCDNTQAPCGDTKESIRGPASHDRARFARISG